MALNQRNDNIVPAIKPISRFGMRLRQTSLLTFVALIVVGCLAIGNYIYSSRSNLSAILYSDGNTKRVVYKKSTDLERAVLVDPRGFAPDYITARLSDSNRNPIFRAASLSLFGQNETEQKNAGSAALVEVEGKLAIVSVGHVIDELKSTTLVQRYAHIPGIGFLNITAAQLTAATRFDPNNGYEGDPILVIALSENEQSMLRQKTSNGEITPLQIDSTAPKHLGNFGIANPKTGQYIPLTYVNTRLGRLKSTNEEDRFYQFMVTTYEDKAYYQDKELTLHEILDLNDKLSTAEGLNPDTMICQGVSGSPIVQKDNPRRVVAFLSGGTNFTVPGTTLSCNVAPIARPVGRP